MTALWSSDSDLRGPGLGLRREFLGSRPRCCAGCFLSGVGVGVGVGVGGSVLCYNLRQGAPAPGPGQAREAGHRGGVPGGAPTILSVSTRPEWAHKPRDAPCSAAQAGLAAGAVVATP